MTTKPAAVPIVTWLQGELAGVLAARTVDSVMRPCLDRRAR